MIEQNDPNRPINDFYPVSDRLANEKFQKDERNRALREGPQSENNFLCRRTALVALSPPRKFSQWAANE
jgi:hypothetical protein